VHIKCGDNGFDKSTGIIVPPIKGFIYCKSRQMSATKESAVEYIFSSLHGKSLTDCARIVQQQYDLSQVNTSWNWILID